MDKCKHSAKAKCEFNQLSGAHDVGGHWVSQDLVMAVEGFTTGDEVVAVGIRSDDDRVRKVTLGEFQWTYLKRVLVDVSPSHCAAGMRVLLPDGTVVERRNLRFEVLQKDDMGRSVYALYLGELCSVDVEVCDV
jgi:hypothetical protein